MYERKYHVDYSLCDGRGMLSVLSIMGITQDSCAAHFGEFGCDNLSLKKNHDSMWVFMKYKAYFEESLIWNSEFSVNTYIISHKRLKCVLETDFKDCNGKTFARVFLECCVLDCKTHSLRTLNSIGFPGDYSCPPHSEYSFLGVTEEGFHPLSEYRVMSQDIDASGHMNNISYIRMILNTYSASLLSEMKIRSFEVHYLKETKEASVLSIEKKEEEEMDSFLAKNEGNSFYMSLSYEVKK